jgi:hypothetical protein
VDELQPPAREIGNREGVALGERLEFASRLHANKGQVRVKKRNKRSTPRAFAKVNLKPESRSE